MIYLWPRANLTFFMSAIAPAAAGTVAMQFYHHRFHNLAG